MQNSSATKRRYWVMVAGAALLAFLLAGGVVAETHYQQATADMSQAQQEMHHGQYAGAWTLLQRAKATWQWSAVGTEETLVRTLLASDRAFVAGNAAWESGEWRRAQADLAGVVPQDTHYAAAQHLLGILHQAHAAGRQIAAIIAAHLTLEADLQRFWSDYNHAINYLNPAWQNYSNNYGSNYSPTAFAQDVQSAAPIITSVNNDATAVSTDVSTLSAAVGVLQSTATLHNSMASQLLSTASDLSAQVNTMANAVADELSSLQALAANGTYNGVNISTDIRTTNTALTALQSDQNAEQQESSAVVGYAVGAVTTLLGSSAHLSTLIPNLPASGT